MGAIFRREMGAYFSSPIAYIFLAVFFAFSGFFFFTTSIMYSISDMSGMFGSLFLIIVFLIPVMTMKLFSEEKKQKTEQGLLTAPVSLNAIVVGKYLAALTLYTIGISIIFLYALIIEYFGNADWSVILSNYLALFLVGGVFIAITTFISSLTENQMISAIAGFISLMFIYMIDYIAEIIPWKPVSDAVSKLSFIDKYSEFTMGLFNIGSIIFFLSTIVIFNFLTVRVFEKRRWS